MPWAITIQLGVTVTIADGQPDGWTTVTDDTGRQSEASIGFTIAEASNFM